MKRNQQIEMLRRLYDLLILLFFCGFIFAIRPLVGLTTILLAATAVLTYRLESGKWWNPAFFNLFITGLFLYFVMQTAGLLYTNNVHEGFPMFQTSLGMVVLPVGAFYSGLVNRQSFGRWMKAYVYILFAATLLALAHALITFLRQHDPAVFFYHPLVILYSNHAIQFSVMVFAAILFLMGEYARPAILVKKTWIIFLMVYFSVFLFLLSSKLVIIVYLLYLLYTFAFTKTFIRRPVYRVAVFFILVGLTAGLCFTQTPFNKRMTDVMDGSLSVIRQQKFTPGDYFNGVQFRLLSWRFVYEILNERHAWVIGVSPGDSQDVLDDKYIRENMFTGGTPGNNTGYLNFHSHNQFLQAVLESGLLGLLFFVMACIGLVRMAIKSGQGLLIAYAVLLFCNCFTDAPLRTQYGIILFVFFPLFMLAGNKESGIPAG